jgi:hypothetical protein
VTSEEITLTSRPTCKTHFIVLFSFFVLYFIVICGEEPRQGYLVLTSDMILVGLLGTCNRFKSLIKMLPKPGEIAIEISK